MSTQVLSQFARHLQGQVPIIGVGGIDSGDKAVQKLQAGASMVQLYSGMVYQGPRLIQECVEAIAGFWDLQG